MMEIHPDPTTTTPSASTTPTNNCAPKSSADFKKAEKPYELKYIELCGQAGNENVVFQNQLMVLKNTGDVHGHHHLDDKMVDVYAKAAQNVYSTLPRATQQHSQRYIQVLSSRI